MCVSQLYDVTKQAKAQALRADFWVLLFFQRLRLRSKMRLLWGLRRDCVGGSGKAQEQASLDPDELSNEFF